MEESTKIEDSVTDVVEESKTTVDPLEVLTADDSNVADLTVVPNNPVQDSHHITPQSAAESVLKLRREHFYKVYDPIYNKAEEGGTKLIRKAKYDEILEHLETWDTTDPKKRPPGQNNAHQRYAIGSNVEGHQLFRIIKSNKSSGSGVTA